MADVNKEIALKVTTDTTQTEKAFKSAKQELRDTQRALVEMALAGKQGTAEFVAMERRAGELRDTIGDVNQRINALASDTPKLDLLTKAAEGIAGGFAIAQGAAALFGDENEEVQQAILKTQGALSLLNGVQAVANALNKDSVLAVQAQALAQRVLQSNVVASTLALRGWSAALAATGIGALVVGLGLLVTWFMKTKGASEDATKSLERQKEAQEDLAKSIERTNKARELELQRLALIGKNESEIAQQRLKDLAEQKIALEESIRIEKRGIEALEGLKDSSLLRTRKNFLADKELRLMALENEIIRQTNIITEFEKKKQKITRDSNKIIQQENLKGFQDAARDLILQQEKNLMQELDQLRNSMDAGYKLRIEFEQKQADLSKFYRDLKQQDEENAQRASLSIAAQTFGALSALAASFANENSANAEEAFELSKKLAIAQSIIDTTASAIAAYKSTVGLPIVGPVLAPIAAGAAIAAGLARINQIRQTQFRSPSNPSAATPGVPQLNGNIPAPTGTNVNPQITNLQGGQVQPQGQRVFVVERDITQVQGRLTRVQQFATF